MTPKFLEARLDLIQEDLNYLRSKVDGLEVALRGVMWRVIGLGAGGGALGFVVAIIAQKMVQ